MNETSAKHLQIEQTWGIELVAGSVVLRCNTWQAGEMTIKRAKGRYGNYEVIKTITSRSFTDKAVGKNPFDYYYQVVAADGALVARLSLEEALFGPNFYVYQPEDDLELVAKAINDVHEVMFKEQFGVGRYAFYFKAGDYTQAKVFNIPYYVHIGGLGKLPTDVKINNLHTPAPLPNNNATCTFWRSAENLAIIGPKRDDPLASLMWGVSQAAPLRRIYAERHGYYQWLRDGWGSGGFTADCYFEGAAGSFTQQQWYTRNSFINEGRGNYAVGGWNLAYQGVEFGLDVNLADHTDNWHRNGGVSNTSNVKTTPIIREKPFLFYDNGRYQVFKPALREADSKGVSYRANYMGDGEAYDLLDDFFVVKPGVSAKTMNQQLARGKHLFITPGLYELSEPLVVEQANTIILGTGLATLIPSATNSTGAIVVADVSGVTIASLLFDAHYSSENLLKIGNADANKNHCQNPSLFADLFFRIGGFRQEPVHVEAAVVINSDDVICDHFWIWRADHGAGVGWFLNTAKNGLIVNGDHVTIYGLFNEHFQEYQTLWNGEKGRLYFYQCETPYDPPNQADYLSHNGTRNGYAAYKVADHVQYHEASMLGVYDVFTKTNGAEIAIENSIEVPESAGVQVHHACNVCISPLGGIKFVINGTGKSTFNTKIAARFFVVDYRGHKTPSQWIRKN